MSTQQMQEVPTVPAPRRLSTQLTKLSDADFKMLIVLGACGLPIMGLYGFPGLLGVLLVTTFLMWQLDWSRRYYTWGEALAGVWIRYALNDTLWENWEALHDDGDDTPKKRRRPLRNLIQFRHPFPLQVDTLYDIGLIYNSRSGTDSILIGSEGSDISGMSLQDQYLYQEKIADSIRRAASFEGMTAEIGFVLRRRPYDITIIDASDAQTMYPDVYIPEIIVQLAEAHPGRPLLSLCQVVEQMYAEATYGLPVDISVSKTACRDVRLYKLRLEARIEASNNGTATDMVAVITLRRSNDLRRAARKRGSKPISEQEAYKSRIVQFGEQICDALESASVKDPYIYSPSMCEDYLRAAWDIVGLPEYFKQRANGELEESPNYHPEYGMYVSNKHCVFDQTGHAVVRLDRLPKEIEPNLMQLLFTNSNVQWISRTLASEASTGNAEYRMLYAISAFVDNLVEAAGITRMGAKGRKRRDELDNRQEEIAEAEHAEYFNIYLGTANPLPDQLMADIERLRAISNQVGGHAKQVTGRVRQVPAALTVTTGISLL